MNPEEGFEPGQESIDVIDASPHEGVDRSNDFQNSENDGQEIGVQKSWVPEGVKKEQVEAIARKVQADSQLGNTPENVKRVKDTLVKSRFRDVRQEAADEMDRAARSADVATTLPLQESAETQKERSRLQKIRDQFVNMRRNSQLKKASENGEDAGV